MKGFFGGVVGFADTFQFVLQFAEARVDSMVRLFQSALRSGLFRVGRSDRHNRLIYQAGLDGAGILPVDSAVAYCVTLWRHVVLRWFGFVVIFNVMRKILLGFLVLGFALSTTVARGDDGDKKENCKITVRKKMKNGKTKLEIMTVVTSTREECKLQAEDQRRAMDEDVASIKTSFGFTQ